MRYLNVIGSKIRLLRGLRHWSQRHLAIKLQRCGWDVSRATVSKIESRIAEVGDLQLLYLAEVFGVNLRELYPEIKVRNRDINEVMNSRI